MMPERISEIGYQDHAVYIIRTHLIAILGIQNRIRFGKIAFGQLSPVDH